MKKRSSGGSSSFLLMLFFVFIILKVTGTIAWSWWWVTAPIWMPAALLMGGMILAGLMGVGVFKIVSTVLRRQRFGQAGERGAASPGPHGADDQVVEAEGTEVSSTSVGQGPRSLPQVTSSGEREDPTV